MISPSDFEYKNTKLILKGKKKLEEPFINLSKWINEVYSVNSVNIIYDKVIPNDRPRLQVILEHEKDYLFFKLKDGYNFNEVLQSEISGKFIEIINNNKSYKFETNSIFTIFSCFESVAKKESNMSIKEYEIKKLLLDINNPDLWHIDKCFGATVFFFYTNLQKEKSFTLKNIYTEKYFNLLKKYDEFDYITKNNFSIDFDSKENFEKNFHSNWFTYWR
ncbi:hypothetical protein [Leptospira kanakyensis]|uniref:hypothetical protein n=1 Tax=Leptospira kanakyensis TaxID=2484968 RepID=UPI00223E40BE|nr:hypothetical protein [Leptospira kanakyensis]MCW7471867.1 hypothetical protein [Leptospira kanakyensis]MCW7483323.1 hypothetical protein [Leptospira kanakyensis]